MFFSPLKKQIHNILLFSNNQLTTRSRSEPPFENGKHTANTFGIHHVFYFRYY